MATDYFMNTIPNDIFVCLSCGARLAGPEIKLYIAQQESLNEPVVFKEHLMKDCFHCPKYQRESHDYGYSADDVLNATKEILTA